MLWPFCGYIFFLEQLLKSLKLTTLGQGREQAYIPRRLPQDKALPGTAAFPFGNTCSAGPHGQALGQVSVLYLLCSSVCPSVDLVPNMFDEGPPGGINV